MDSNFNFNVFKEPRGFMRVLQFIFSICAFATTTNFSGQFQFVVKCSNSSDTDPITQNVYYPFQLDHEIVNRKICGKEYKYAYPGDFSSDSQYFVAVGVLALLYSLASAVFYVLFGTKYESIKTFPLVDFIISTIFGVLWLSGSAAWASGLTALKYTTNPQNFFKFLESCNDNTCSLGYLCQFAALNISVIFGFLNFILWAANLWFLYKETSWFQGNPASTSTSAAAQP